MEGNFESYLAAVAVMSAVATHDGPFDAVIRERCASVRSSNGVNTLAIKAFVSSSIVALTLALVAAFGLIPQVGRAARAGDRLIPRSFPCG